MHGAAYAQSSKIARDHGGPFAGYEKNREPFLRVMRKHRAALKDIDKTHVPKDLCEAAKNVWDEVIEMGEQHGFRNAQATVLAPTGTIGFMMDCDTTGVEPDIALVKYKKLVGGGLMKIVNQTVPMALAKLGYSQHAGQGDRRVHRRERDHRRGAAHQGLAPAGVRLRVQAGARRAVDPLHGPHQDDGRDAAVPLGRDLQDGQRAEGSDVEEIEQAYIDSWRIGREGGVDLSRRLQAHAAAEHSKDKENRASAPAPLSAEAPRRRRLPDERNAITHKFDIAGHEGYITVGLFEDGTPGELFLVMAKEGSTISGFADAFAQAICYALQYGVPLQDLVDKFSHVRFEPSGMTKNPDVRFAKSIVDYIFRWMATKFLSPDAQFRAGVNNREELRDYAGAAAARCRRRRRGIADRRHHLEADVVVRGDAEPGGRAAVLDVRVDHGPQRVVLQVRELRDDERLRVIFGTRDSGRELRVAIQEPRAGEAQGSGAGESRPFSIESTFQRLRAPAGTWLRSGPAPGL